ncbi:unnamed protein product [Miscanthus lutarioriparius]|uniref:KIB1-4 beta-propeller domain-containing protein n=1 Tax=Miscanthus lutarioriparius TaxID=422564 RepID=A0A811NLH9_9POAL|nr:unnamed protein product [Miscanthus lutarioriparius]
MRRRPGIAGLQNAAATRDQFRLVGENVAKVRTDVMKEQLATFRSQLEEFARKHKSDIRKNPVFRQQFHEMCAKVGVDPLASNKGVWAELLGIGDFYYELGVQIVDICIATRSHNGGLIDLLDLRKLLGQKRKATLESLSEDDCLRAISKLKVLGSGFEVISVGRRKLVRSVPTELNKDHSGILGLAQAEGYVTVEQVEREFSWSTGRAIDALETLLKEGLAMIDDGHRDAKRRYWFPCVTVSSDTAAVEANEIKRPLVAPKIDFFALRASCRAYRAVLPPSRGALACQSPLLLVALFPSFSEALFHLSLRRLPWGHHLPPSRRTLHYAHGYLVTATTASSHYPPRLLLLHLFSGEQLRLPKVPAPFTRVIVSDDLATVLFLPGRPNVQHCHPGDALWRVATADAPHVVDDMLFVDATLYALVNGLRLATVELSDSLLGLSFLGEEVDDDSKPAGGQFTLGECGGAVLLISQDHTEMMLYHVYRWAFEVGKWVSITSLGERTLFLGFFGFAACIGSYYPGIRGDCLYAAGPRLGEWHEHSLADGTCDVHYADYPGAPPLNNNSPIRPQV